MEDLIIVVIMIVAGIGSMIKKATEAEKEKQAAQQRKQPSPQEPEPVEAGFRKCEKCGTVNLEEAHTCFGCGARFSEVSKAPPKMFELLHVPRIEEQDRLERMKEREQEQIRLERMKKRIREPVRQAVSASPPPPVEEESFFEESLEEEEFSPLVERLQDPDALSETVVLKEILEPPLALRKK